MKAVVEAFPRNEASLTKRSANRKRQLVAHEYEALSVRQRDLEPFIVFETVSFAAPAFACIRVPRFSRKIRSNWNRGCEWERFVLWWIRWRSKRAARDFLAFRALRIPAGKFQLFLGFDLSVGVDSGEIVKVDWAIADSSRYWVL